MVSTEHVSWRVLPGYQILARCWGEECVVYHPGSGDTHLIDIHAYQLLQALEREDATAAGLARHLAESSGLEENHDLKRYVERALRELHRFSMIEPATP